MNVDEDGGFLNFKLEMTIFPPAKIKMRNQLNLVLEGAGAGENMFARFCVEQTDREPGAPMEGSLGFMSGSHCSHKQPTIMAAEGWGLGSRAVCQKQAAAGG